MANPLYMSYLKQVFQIKRHIQVCEWYEYFLFNTMSTRLYVHITDRMNLNQRRPEREW